MAASRPKIFNIAAGAPFLDRLAHGLIARHGADSQGANPLALSPVTVLLPTRRACRGLREAFLRAGAGQAMLLPMIRPLGDVDDDEFDLGGDPAGGEANLALPPAIAPLRRLLLLARLVRRHPGIDDNPAIAARLARALADLLDSAATERLSLDGLDKLVPADHAEHWQITLRFLAIVRENWPKILAEYNLIEPAARRVRLLSDLAQRWRQLPPPDPIYAAGSTGSIPATADLLKTICRLPQGAVVLPGLDGDLDDATWARLGADPTHPQHGLWNLLERIGVGRAEVDPWPHGGEATPRAARVAMLGAALRPAAVTEGWRALPAFADAAFAGLKRLDCPGPREEAASIALILREALEKPGRTAALVTPDRELARRVAAELRRWRIDVDDSAGIPLDRSPPGVFLRLTGRMIAEQFAPVPLLAVLKHPLAAGGTKRSRFLRFARRLERRVLRGPRPAPGLAGLRQAILGLDDEAELLAWFDGLAAAVRPFADLCAGSALLAELIEAHVRFAEWLSAPADDAKGAALWQGEAGDALGGFIAELLEAAPEFDTVPGRDWPALLDALMADRVVRPVHGRHPRLHIWGLLEARLQQADVIVLGGLNEGIWPPEAGEDPWFSRPMRQKFGLPPLERRIGLTAHDFVQAAAARQVYLVRSEKSGGTPQVASRWLLRLDAMLTNDQRWRQGTANDYLAWQAAIDTPKTVITPQKPMPRPPIAARPRRLSVTQVETWIRDPYAIYARHVLGLRILDDLDAEPGAADRGRLVHRALDAFLRAYPKDLPRDALARLIALAETSFLSLGPQPTVRAFWLPRFERIAEWFVSFEHDRRAKGIRTIATECRGRIELPGPAGPFVLIAIADRIDRLADGRLAVLDYKTGQVPSQKQVAVRFAPQLPLEAAIAAAGGFAAVPAAEIGEIAFIRLGGGDPPGQLKPIEPDQSTLAALTAESIAALARLIRQYDDPNMPYLSKARPEWRNLPGDYDHLARIGEWSSGAEE